MNRILFIFASLAAVAALHFSGLLTRVNLTHPVWRENATLYGSLAGAGLSALVFWACAAKPRLGRWLERLVMLGFIIALPVTLISAKIFIDAAEYNALAVQLWHKGSYTVFITFVPSLAALLAKLRIIGSPARG
ncbi:MAG TPA: hypothetical protein EYG79_08405 [Rhodobacteraceae bacterium]|nr:hypothetical protein [Paracoccaceae bacterium]